MRARAQTHPRNHSSVPKVLTPKFREARESVLRQLWKRNENVNLRTPRQLSVRRPASGAWRRTLGPHRTPSRGRASESARQTHTAAAGLVRCAGSGAEAGAAALRAVLGRGRQKLAHRAGSRGRGQGHLPTAPPVPPHLGRGPKRAGSRRGAQPAPCGRGPSPVGGVRPLWAGSVRPLGRSQSPLPDPRRVPAVRRELGGIRV